MNRKLVAVLLQEEEDDDALLVAHFEGMKRKRKEVKALYKTRSTEGYSNILIANHLLGDIETFRQFFRLNKDQVDFVLNLVGADLKKQSCRRVQSPISPQEKVLLTLRFLATGESFQSLSYAFRISPGYISIIIKDTLKHLCRTLVPIFMPQPSISDFRKIARQFSEKWNFPNCIGALDGKHVRVLCPKNSGSLYFNYKNYFSLVLLALVDADYRFIVIDVGSYGKEGDSGILEKSVMGQQIRTGTFNFPTAKALPRSHTVVPHVIVGDEAFRLTKHMMKPYPKNLAAEDQTKKIFNYRLCRARRVSENAFGLLSQCFRVFYSPIAVLPDTTDSIITVSCCLHNMLRDEYMQNDSGSQQNSEAQLPTGNMLPLGRAGGFGNLEGFEVRNKIRRYFNAPQGAVEWQENCLAV